MDPLINLYSSPIVKFTIIEPQNLEIGDFYVVRERRTTVFEATYLWKGQSGN